jgi:hypothetical protein
MLNRAGRARRACGEDVRLGGILAASMKQEPTVSAVLPLSRNPLPSGSGGRQKGSDCEFDVVATPVMEWSLTDFLLMKIALDGLNSRVSKVVRRQRIAIHFSHGNY